MTATAEDAPAKKKSKLPLIIIIVLVLVIAGGAAWFLFLKPAPDAAAAEEPEPEAGAVLTLEPQQINLAGGHYLQIGIAVQQTIDVAEDLDGSKALDATIELFSGKAVDDLDSQKERTALKEELLTKVESLYNEEATDDADAVVNVMDVYFTTFVYQ
ncbi:flagellar basal body-associated FliL family protein [Nocardioides bruguierae]|uniref:Flagellar protein FliL n=1 Tax=Nocardioides bruguierae TaxID=2945102 RepID=A0A9X2II87_9ACTN|nr:flagellar basal body-associated FliL family protein [Nocardioides bruguierae]MCL8027688.1 flagellar basal body-associated FliL family protein [Nocardioides bruguierae]MCM0622555.1 flagellar basal body-associated FliL family protein [Nocardioides bruguierae]